MNARPGIENLHPNRRAVPPGAAHLHQGNTLYMKALETVISIIAFIMLAIVLFALSPLLIKLIEAANHLTAYPKNRAAR